MNIGDMIVKISPCKKRAQATWGTADKDTFQDIHLLNTSHPFLTQEAGRVKFGACQAEHMLAWYQPAVHGNGKIAPHTNVHFVARSATRLHPDEVHSAGLREHSSHSFEKRQLRVYQVGRNRRPLHVLLPAWERPGLAEADGQVHHRNVAFTHTKPSSLLFPPNSKPSSQN